MDIINGPGDPTLDGHIEILLKFFNTFREDLNDCYLPTKYFPSL